MERELNEHMKDIISSSKLSKKMTKELFLLRGLPGSGKSTLAKSLDGFNIEADQFFMEDGVYKFDVTKLKWAHDLCKMECERAMKDNIKIVISNTFTQEWEMTPYFELAEKYGYRVYSLIVENRHGGINEHEVPEDKLQIMKNRFEIKLI
jgi:energy-coupling factor transporter ATP-binding protein EcfA2